MENFQGEKQFIASALITTKSFPKKILLLHHKKLDSWVQPGGHIEHTENPIEAIIREVKEETGLDISACFSNFEQMDNSLFLPVPRFVLEEKIPEHAGHPAHYHIDLQYQVEIEEAPVVYSKTESHGIGWFTKEEALNLPIFENTRKMIEEILS